MSVKKKKVVGIEIISPGSAPDVDSDFNTSIRENVVQYVADIYGKENVSNIGTFGTLAAKGAFKAMCTIYEIPFAQANKISSLIPPPLEGEECTLEDIFNPASDRYSEGEDFRNATASEEWREIVEGARKIEGRNKNIGMHACFAPDALIKTADGYSVIVDVKPGDRVLTHTNTYKQVVETITTEGQELFFLSANNSVPVEVTGNHPVLVRSKIVNKSNDISFTEPYWKNVDELVPGADFLGTPINTDKVVFNNNRLLPTHNILFWKNIGMLLGSASKESSAGQTRSASKEAVWLYLDEFGKNDKTRVLPNHIESLPTDLLRGFIDGYLSVGGRKYGEELYAFKTPSKAFALGMIAIINKAYNVFVDVVVDDNNEYNLSFKYGTPDPNLAFYDGSFIWGAVNTVTPLDKFVTTYNLSVVDDNSYVANGFVAHNCGVIVSTEPLKDVIPLNVRQSDGKVLSQWTYKELEELGLIKMDFLGLDTIDIIQKTVEYIGKNGKVAPNMLTLIHGDMDDKKVYELFQKGHTTGVFQFGSEMVRGLLPVMNPTEFNDITACTAVARPGPMGMRSHIKYADRKNGREQVDYIHPEFKGTVVEEILGTTYGLCVPKGTEIFDSTAGKYIAIENLQEDVSTTPSINLETGALENKPVRHVMHTGMKEIVRITLNGNRTIEVSEDHPVMTNSGYVKAGELLSGDHVLVNDREFEHNSDCDNTTDDLAYFLGAMLGDGSFVSGNQPYFTNSNDSILNEIERIVSNSFDDAFVVRTYRTKPGEQDPYTTVLTINSEKKETMRRGKATLPNPVNQWFSQMGYDGKILMYDKYLSSEVMSLSNEKLKHLIAGLWDTDGSVTRTGLHLTTTSATLFKDVKKALVRLGVDFGVSINPYKNKTRQDRVAYRIYPSHRDFSEKIQKYLRSDTKKQSYVNRSYESHNGIVKLHYDKISSDFAQWAKDNLDENYFSKKTWRNIAEKNRILYRPLKDFIQKNYSESAKSSRDILSILRQEQIVSKNYLAHIDARYRRVLRVERIGLKDCYDIEVDDNHNFFVDGVLTSNCVYQEQVVKLANTVAGMSMVEADDLRKAMGKKIKEKMDLMRPKFFSGALANGYSQEAVETLWNTIAEFAKYGFNKCAHGDTIIIDEFGRKIRLRDAYKKWINRDKNLQIMSMWEDGEIRPHGVRDIVFTGKEHTYEIVTESGKNIKVTKEHRLLTNNGYGSIDEGSLYVGAELIVDETEYGFGLSDKNSHAESNTIHDSEPVWVKNFINSLKKFKALNGKSFNTPTQLSDGRYCDSMIEAAAGEYLLARGVDFELHKVVENPVTGTHRVSDFYANGIHFEMDGMSRGAQWFIDNKYGDTPFVYLTPYNFVDKIDEALSSVHAKNGDKIVSITKSDRKHKVYDVEMQLEGPSNFIANKIVSHNSHSVAYAMNAYQEAFLKTYYPVEFMAALIAQNVGDRDKTLSFLRETKRMGLKVGTVDINLSDVMVAPDYSNKSGYEILFGLSGVKEISENTASIIVQERTRNGLYKSVQNLIDRCSPLGVTNKKVFENLALAGAFDLIQPNRKVAMESVSDLMGGAKKKTVLGESLFDMFDVDDEQSVDENALDFPFVERLKHEADMVGLYLSAHPLDNVPRGIGGSTTIEKLLKQKTMCETTLIASVVDIKTKQFRKGKSIILDLDDGTDFMTLKLSPSMVGGIEKFEAQENLKKLYQYGENHVSSDLEGKALNPKFTSIPSIEKNSVYLIKVTFLPSRGGGPYMARADLITPLSFTQNGSLPLRIRLKDTGDNSKRINNLYKKLPPALSEKFPGDLSIMIAKTGNSSRNNTVRRDDPIRQAIVDMEKSSSSASPDQKDDDNIFGESVSKNAKKKSSKREILRSWPPVIDSAAIEARFGSKTITADIVDDIELIEYEDTGLTCSRESGAIELIEKYVGIEGFDFGIFNKAVLDDD